MATMYPRQLPDRIVQDPRRSAEVFVFNALRDDLPKSFHVFYSRAWVARRLDGHAADGEADFVIVHAERPILLMEVKGGRIGYDGEKDCWTSTNRDGEVFEIDPVRQLRDSKHAMIALLKRIPAWGGRWIDIGHCVAFPHCNLVPGAQTTDLPSQITFDAQDFHRLAEKLEDVQKYWVDQDKLRPIGRDGLEVLKRMLAPTFVLPTPIGPDFDEAERRIVELTEEQFDLLEVLKANPRVAVAGGAGTGKTLLALEKACRLAGDVEGPMRTLLVCFNRPLAEHLAEAARSNGCTGDLTVTTFHQLCYDLALLTNQKLRAPDQGNPPRTFFEQDLPMALLEAVAARPSLRFDAIVVDEGQDFLPMWWTALELACTGGSGGTFYIFYDNNQKIYRHIGSLPLGLVPAALTRNLRNTQSIFRRSLRFYSGRPVMRAAGPPGREVKSVEVATEAAAVDGLSKVLHELVTDGAVRPRDIVILVGHSLDKSFLGRRQQVGAFRLIRDARAVSVPDALTGHGVLLSTIHRFKGLERPVVILIDVDHIDDELMYVGLSRARIHLVVIGNANTMMRVSENGV